VRSATLWWGLGLLHMHRDQFEGYFMRVFLARILPEAVMTHLLHLRPRAWVIVSAHMSIGFILALGLNSLASEASRWILAVLAWGVLGNGGTLALNSAFDRDEGDIGYLEDPPPVPDSLAVFALFLLVLGGLVASFVGSAFLLAYVICSILSVLYSVPPIRLKARGGWDILINSVGYGGLTIYAGWAASGREVGSPILGVVAAFAAFFVGF
jgi:4-hydroxybenzoate polyprenyltransferase